MEERVTLSFPSRTISLSKRSAKAISRRLVCGHLQSRPDSHVAKVPTYLPYVKQGTYADCAACYLPRDRRTLPRTWSGYLPTSGRYLETRSAPMLRSLDYHNMRHGWHAMDVDCWCRLSASYTRLPVKGPTYLGYLMLRTVKGTLGTEHYQASVLWKPR